MFLGKSIWLIFVFLSIIAAGISHAAGMKRVPQDFQVHLNWGAVQAEFGRIDLAITSKGGVKVELKRGSYDTPPTVRKYKLRQDELLVIYQEILNNDFFGLKDNYSDDKVMDGGSSSWSIKAGGITKSVSIYNTNVEAIEKIFAKINEILKQKDKFWDEYPRL